MASLLVVLALIGPTELTQAADAQASVLPEHSAKQLKQCAKKAKARKLARKQTERVKKACLRNKARAAVRGKSRRPGTRPAPAPRPILLLLPILLPILLLILLPILLLLPILILLPIPLLLLIRLLRGRRSCIGVRVWMARFMAGVGGTRRGIRRRGICLSSMPASGCRLTISASRRRGSLLLRVRRLTW